MPRTRHDILENRCRLRTKYDELLDSIAALLLRFDHVGINFGVNSDGYLTEAETILPRLRGCHSADDLLQVVHAEFVSWFDYDIAGPQERYTEIASEVWQLWQEYLARRHVPINIAKSGSTFASKLSLGHLR